MGKFRGKKGPWSVTDRRNGRFLINNGEIDVWFSLVNVTQEEAKANAMLISRAPEILEMLEIVYQQVDFSFEAWGSDTGLKMEAEIKKLIKEATEL